jgi:Amino acid kinase family
MSKNLKFPALFVLATFAALLFQSSHAFSTCGNFRAVTKMRNAAGSRVQRMDQLSAFQPYSRSRALMQMSSVDLSTVGSDISIKPSADGIKKIVMKFGGSSLATAERITYVARLIKKHVEAGYKPMIVCSAMGKTTNGLLSAGDFALSGTGIMIDSIRTLHLTTAETLGLPQSTMDQLNDLLKDLERLLEGIRYIGELTPRTKDALVSFGERMSIRIVAATLNKMGVPAQAFDAWTLGISTTSEFGNAEVRNRRREDIE